MKTPKIEEVREYFKDALEIKDNHGDILKMSKINKKGIYKSGDCFYADDSKDNDFSLYNSFGYAEITKYKEKKDFKTITDNISSLLEYKNKKYGNSALEPLDIFKNKCKAGDRLDDKIARIKNNSTLQKNDVADLIGYLILTCKENNWYNFDEFKD